MCISRFSNRKVGAKDPLSAAADLFRGSLETGRFFHKTCQFSVIARRAQFLRGIDPHRLSNISFRKLFRFPAKPTRFVIASRAQLLRPTRQSLTERFATPKRNMVARDEAEPKGPRNQSAAALCGSSAPTDRFET